LFRERIGRSADPGLGDHPARLTQNRGSRLPAFLKAEHYKRDRGDKRSEQPHGKHLSDAGPIIGSALVIPSVKTLA
jgi:hypothetical protein